MPTPFIVIVAIWFLPVAIYALRATNLIGERVSTILYGCTFILIGVSFLAFFALIYMQAGETMQPIKGGYKPLGAEESAPICP